MDVSTVQEKDIGSRRKIGKLNNRDVWLLETKGGFCIVASLSEKGTIDVLGCGQHEGVAKFMAEKEHPQLQITELQKSELPTRQEMSLLLPQARKYFTFLKIQQAKCATFRK